MASISNNSTAASALSLLTGSNKALEHVTIQVASGRSVNKASDNAAYWSIATSMRSTGMSLASVQDASGLAAATTDIASLGMEAATGIVSQIQSKLILARSSGVDRDAVNAEITQLKQQLGTVTESSSFNGQNWLSAGSTGTPGVKSLPASLSKNADGTTSLNTIEFDTASTTLTSSANPEDGLLTKSYSGTTENGSAYDYHLLDSGSTPASSTSGEIKISSATTNDELDGMISATSSMLSGLTSAGAKLGATSSRIGGNEDFLANLHDTIERGVGRLVDADMEESAVKLQSIKVQQQLQIIGLNIVNEQSKTILDLFR